MAHSAGGKDYDKVIEKLFFQKYKEGAVEVDFTKDELVEVANQLGITIRNVPDVLYTFRCRGELPDSICDLGNWLLAPRGKGRYSFLKSSRKPFVEIQEGLVPVEVPNSLPEIVEKHSNADEQSLLSSIRYNRLIDIFTGITCFHLQSHLRTTINGEGQIEVDELYVGIDTDGNEYIMPLEAKSPDDRDKLGWFQISSMVKFVKQQFPDLICKPLAAKPVGKYGVYLFEFNDEPDFEKIGIVEQKYYKLIRPSSVQAEPVLPLAK